MGVIVDCSPSEQLVGDDKDVLSLGIVAGFSVSALEDVGSKYPTKEHRLRLKKWSSAGKTYRSRVISHTSRLVNENQLVLGVHGATKGKVRQIGINAWSARWGRLPSPNRSDSSGKWYELGEYRVSGSTIDSFEAREGDLAILGWYASALAGFHQFIEAHRGQTTIDFIIDRLPNDTGGRDRAVLVKEMVRSLTKDRGTVMQPDRSDHCERDLLVDNVASLARMLIESPESQLANEVNELDRALYGIVNVLPPLKWPIKP